MRVAGHCRAGRPRIYWQLEERVIALARAFPVMGLRRIAARVGISHPTVFRIIREKGLWPSRVQIMQELRPRDRYARKEFCRWTLQKLPTFFGKRTVYG